MATVESTAKTTVAVVEAYLFYKDDYYSKEKKIK